MDSLSFDEIADTAFSMGMSYGGTWFTIYLVVILGAFIYKIIKGL